VRGQSPAFSFIFPLFDFPESLCVINENNAAFPRQLINFILQKSNSLSEILLVHFNFLQGFSGFDIFTVQKRLSMKTGGFIKTPLMEEQTLCEIRRVVGIDIYNHNRRDRDSRIQTGWSC